MTKKKLRKGIKLLTKITDQKKFLASKKCPVWGAREKILCKSQIDFAIAIAFVTYFLLNLMA